MSNQQHIRFLSSFGQALAAVTLYAEGHPSRERMTGSSFDRLRELQDEQVPQSFTFLDTGVVYEHRTLRELRSWEWSTRLESVGLQRLEFTDLVPRAEYNAFLNELGSRFMLGAAPPSMGETAADGQPPVQAKHPSIRFGMIGPEPERPAFSYHDEIQATDFMFGEVEAGHVLPGSLAENVVASLAVAMHGHGDTPMPVLDLQDLDRYLTNHSINVTVLVMALAESMGLGPRDVRVIGLSGLLHDVGMVRVPREIVNKAGVPTASEWEIIHRHPTHSAQICLAGDASLDLAAVVSHEHHMWQNGSGYPAKHFERERHFASKMVQVCAVYDALRTGHHYREALPHVQAMRYVEERAGSEFDIETARTFIAMLRRRDRRMSGIGTQTPVRRSGVAGRTQRRTPLFNLAVKPA